MKQLALKVVAPVGIDHLSDKQRAAWFYVKSRAGGCTPRELGEFLFERRGKTQDVPDGEWIRRCATEGRGVLRSAGLSRLVIRRRASGRYEPRVAETVPLEPLPDGEWEDLF